MTGCGRGLVVEKERQKDRVFPIPPIQLAAGVRIPLGPPSNGEPIRQDALTSPHQGTRPDTGGELQGPFRLDLTIGQDEVTRAREGGDGIDEPTSRTAPMDSATDPEETSHGRCDLTPKPENPARRPPTFDHPRGRSS